MQKGEMRADIEVGQQVLQSTDDPRADERVLKTGQRLGARLREADGVEALPSAVAAEVIRRGLLEIFRRTLDSLCDDHRGVGHDRLFAPSRPTELRFGDLAQQHCEMRLAEAAENRRLSFEREQLEAFFHGAYYQRCAASGPEPFSADEEGSRFRLPLRRPSRRAGRSGPHASGHRA